MVKRNSQIPMILLIVSILMIGYGGYMSVIDLQWDAYETGCLDDGFVPDEEYISPDDGEEPVNTVTTTNPIPTSTVPIKTTDPINPLPDVPTIVRPPIPRLPDMGVEAGNIFGSDGTLNLANIILFLGIMLFVIAFLMGKR